MFNQNENFSNIRSSSATTMVDNVAGNAKNSQTKSKTRLCLLQAFSWKLFLMPEYQEGNVKNWKQKQTVRIYCVGHRPSHRHRVKMSSVHANDSHLITEFINCRPQIATMADEYSSKPQYPQYKTRSASISAPTSSSLEAIINASEGCGEAPELSTPNNRRRRPATRSQSARITGAKSVKIYDSVECRTAYCFNWLIENYCL